MTAPRAIYLHFLDRELCRSVGHHPTAPEIVEICVTLLLTTPYPLYCGQSVAWEGVPAKAVRAVGKLVELGFLTLVSSHGSVGEFLDTRDRLYRHDRDRYPMYFSSRDRDERAIFRSAEAKRGSVTSFLRRGLADWAVSQESALIASKIRTALDTQPDAAITRTVFEADAGQHIWAIAKAISGLYTNHYLDFSDGDIVTGLNAYSPFDDLTRSFPRLDFRILKSVLDKVEIPQGLVGRAMRDVEAWRGSAVWTEFSGCISRALEHLASLLGVTSPGATRFVRRNLILDFIKRSNWGCVVQKTSDTISAIGLALPAVVKFEQQAAYEFERGLDEGVKRGRAFFVVNHSSNDAVLPGDRTTVGAVPLSSQSLLLSVKNDVVLQMTPTDQAKSGNVDGPGPVRSVVQDLLGQNGNTVRDGTVDGLVVLAVATEWSSGHGGLSTFNRELCKVLASVGCRVFCLVLRASESEIVDGASLGVGILVAKPVPGLNDHALLAQGTTLPNGISPDVVIGHGRVTGEAAREQKSHFPGSLRVHFFHVAPEAIEWFKEHQSGASATVVGSARSQADVDLAADADLAVAVGPLLHREFDHKIPGNKKVHRFDPGLFEAEVLSDVNIACECLVLGRAEDAILKGIDIAARAMGTVYSTLTELKPVLVVRGIPPTAGDALRPCLLEWAESSALEIRMRPYSSDADQIANDIRQSSLVLMPSRSEGFGLVGLEAISLGVPVLVSDKSGLGELIEELGRDIARHHVVPVARDLSVDGAAWGARIRSVLEDREASRQRVLRLREALREKGSWRLAAEKFVAALRPLVRGQRKAG